MALLECLRRQLEKEFELKMVVVGEGDGTVSEAKVLNRVLRRSEQGWEYDGDPRHSELIVK